MDSYSQRFLTFNTVTPSELAESITPLTTKISLVNPHILLTNVVAIVEWNIRFVD
jgi:hypothetical protein